MWYNHNKTSMFKYFQINFESIFQESVNAPVTFKLYAI